jgi:ribosomal protein S18 acetylase RimI-like enzyme
MSESSQSSESPTSPESSETSGSSARAFDETEITFRVINKEADLPAWCDRQALATFLHSTMKPWEDTLTDIHRAFDYCFSDSPGRGGFMILAERKEWLVGAVVFLNTGMGGYVPEHILLFISVDPELRGRGLGRRLMERALARCEGAVKLHVEYENPAKRLYERMGFKSKYAEMRYKP